MDVIREVCQSCGMTNEVLTRRFSDYVPSCSFCGAALRSPKTVTSVGSSRGGTLQLRNVPGRGLGVFALRKIEEKTLVERCPVFVFKSVNESIINVKMLPYSNAAHGLTLGHMLLPWVNNDTRAIATGYAMLYNHEPIDKSNLRYEPYIDGDTNRRFLDFYSKRAIEAGEELTQTYASNDKLWFTYKAGGQSA